MKKFLSLVLLLALPLPAVAGTLTGTLAFSLDPASPSITRTITPDDVLRAGPLVRTPGTSLGLRDRFF